VIGQGGIIDTQLISRECILFLVLDHFLESTNSLGTCDLHWEDLIRCMSSGNAVEGDAIAEIGLLGNRCSNMSQVFSFAVQYWDACPL
jgi:hypothetical protein